MLPLDFLAASNVYLPASPQMAKIQKPNATLSDLVLQWEPARQFAVSEFRAGRLPMWMPYQYAGVPIVWPKFSPFMLLQCCMASPIILAWAQVAAAIVGGVGAYAFFRRALGVGFWAAAIPAWCFPLTGFFVFWQGYPTCAPVFWLPWQLLMVDGVIRRRTVYPAIGLSLTTALILVSGALDIGGQVLLISGLYALWCLFDSYRHDLLGWPVRKALVSVALGWIFGFALATPYVLPLLEYAHTGARMERRHGGLEARPPEGLSALPALVLPDIYGASRVGSFRYGKQPQVESSSAGYAGILAALFVAPLAWSSRRHRSGNIFWCFLTLFGMSWCLAVPGLLQLLRLPGLNMMSHNRLVFASSFSLLALAATGLDVLLRAEIRPQWWFWVPAGVLICSAGWCAYRTVRLPEPIASQIGRAIDAGHPVGWIKTPADYHHLQRWFTGHFAASAVLSIMGAMLWLALWHRPVWPAWAVGLLAVLLVSDLLWNAAKRNQQCDPRLYYPRVPILEKIAALPKGRIVTWQYLPAALAQTHGLYDIRGYDAIDPARLMYLMTIAADPRSPKTEYSMTQSYLPRIKLTAPDQLQLSPIFDMLGVRYVLFRGTPPAGVRPMLQQSDIWAMENKTALPRVFIPRHVESTDGDEDCFEKVTAPEFDARETGYVEETLNLPASCLGQATIVSEIPTRITVPIKMETAGLVVLADLWDKGWNAYLNGRRIPIHRVDYAIRGVIVPAGEATLEFRYEPASFRLGIAIAGTAALCLLVLAGMTFRMRRRAAGCVPADQPMR